MAETLDAAIATDLTADSAWWWKRPDAKDDGAKTDEDTSVTIPVLDNDVGALGIVKVNGTAVTADTAPVTLTSGATVDLEGKTLLYDPGEDFQGLNSGESKQDTFSYTVVGKYKSTDTATVDVSIAGVTDDDPSTNQPPVANNDTAFIPDYYPYPGPIPLPYEESASTEAANASLSDGPIMTTLAIGEEGDPNPYPSSVQINVLDNDKDPDGDPLHVATIAGTKVDTDPTTDLPDSVTLGSGAKVALNADGSLTYSEGIIVYADTDPQPLTEEAVTLAGGELVPIDPILPPEPAPYPGPWLVDKFTYTAADNGGTAIDDEGLESNAATVTVYHAFYDYILAAEPVTDASAPVASEPSTDIAAAEPVADASAALDQPNDLLA